MDVKVNALKKHIYDILIYLMGQKMEMYEIERGFHDLLNSDLPIDHFD